jgi:DNA-binding response OmpR family regulator
MTMPTAARAQMPTAARAQMPTAARAQVLPDSAKGGHASLVLVIDDDAALRHALASVLASYGIRAVTACDGREGLAQFRRLSPPVVLTDIIMPEQDGIGAIMTMRGEQPGVRIIAMSGGGRIGRLDFLSVAKQLGADEILKKPIVVHELVATVQAQLGAGL